MLKLQNMFFHIEPLPEYSEFKLNYTTKTENYPKKLSTGA